jgi:hypothetical protein
LITVVVREFHIQKAMIPALPIHQSTGPKHVFQILI